MSSNLSFNYNNPNQPLYHLGSVRVVLNQSMAILEQNDYLTF